MIDILLLPKNFTDGKLNAATLKAANDIIKRYGDVSISVLPNNVDEIGVTFLDKECTLGSISSFAPNTYPEVTALEVAMAIENGADFVEIPFDVEKYHANPDQTLSFIKFVAEEIGDDAELWVELESNNFEDFDSYRAAISSVAEAGVDGVVLNSSATDLNNIAHFKKCIVEYGNPSNRLKFKILTNNTPHIQDIISYAKHIIPRIIL
ncbi:MAG: hypothetical protein R3Y04_00050 [Rikenellaceae bacterium]